MKRTLLATLVFFISMLSCDKSAYVETQKNDEIRFSNELVTKANTGIVDGTSFLYDDFGVYGYVSDGDAVVGTEVTSGYIFKNAKYIESTSVAGTWVPDAGAKYYWPKADNKDDINVNFVAYTPHVASPSWASDVLTISLDGTGIDDSCVDYLYATKTNVHPTNLAVPLTFSHALAWIEFQAKKDASVARVDITKIELSSKLYGKSTLAINTKTCAVTPGAASDVMADFVNFAQRNNTNLTTSYAILSDMLVVPQNVPTQVTITFDITIQNASEGESILYKGRQITKTINAGNDMNDQAYQATFASGKKYVYRIYVTADEIIFSADVDNWDAYNPFQVWDHDATAYVEHFFGKASTQMEQRLAIA